MFSCELCQSENRHRRLGEKQVPTIGEMTPNDSRTFFWGLQTPASPSSGLLHLLDETLPPLRSQSCDLLGVARASLCLTTNHVNRSGEDRLEKSHRMQERIECKNESNARTNRIKERIESKNESNARMMEVREQGTGFLFVHLKPSRRKRCKGFVVLEEVTSRRRVFSL